MKLEVTAGLLAGCDRGCGSDGSVPCEGGSPGDGLGGRGPAELQTRLRRCWERGGVSEDAREDSGWRQCGCAGLGDEHDLRSSSRLSGDGCCRHDWCWGSDGRGFRIGGTALDTCLCVAPLLGCFNTRARPLVVDDTIRPAHVAVLGDARGRGQGSGVEARGGVAARLVWLWATGCLACCSGCLRGSNEHSSSVQSGLGQDLGGGSGDCLGRDGLGPLGGCTWDGDGREGANLSHEQRRCSCCLSSDGEVSRADSGRWRVCARHLRAQGEVEVWTVSSVCQTDIYCIPRCHAKGWAG